MSKGMNAKQVLNNINNAIAELEGQNLIGAKRDYTRFSHRGYDYTKGYSFKINAVYSELSIFDWWNESLSMSQLKQMKSFVETAISLGFEGYVCFKVGAAGCSHGMWAHKEESTNGYSPEGDVLFHSFRSGDNYYDMQLNNEWMHDKYATAENRCPDFNLKQIKAELGLN